MTHPHVLLLKLLKLKSGETIISKVPCSKRTNKIINHDKTKVALVHPMIIEKNVYEEDGRIVEATSIKEWISSSNDDILEIDNREILLTCNPNENMSNCYFELKYKKDFIKDQPELAKIVYSDNLEFDDEIRNEEDEEIPLDDRFP